MKTRIFLSLLLFVSLGLMAQEGKNFIDQPYIEVTGKAEKEVIPDEVYLKIKISELDNKAKQSVEELERALIKTLLSLGIDVEKDLSILDFSSNFRQNLFRKTDIRTEKQYQLITHDGKTTAAVFVELEKLNISNIEIDKIGHSKMEEFQNEVKVLAIKAAKDKAGMLAAGINQEIGPALFIQELGNPYYPRVQRAGNIMMKGFAEAEMEAGLPEIEFEKIKLEYSILVRFALK